MKGESKTHKERVKQVNFRSEGENRLGAFRKDVGLWRMEKGEARRISTARQKPNTTARSGAFNLNHT